MPARRPLTETELLDQLLLHTVCGGKAPVRYSAERWQQEYEGKKVYRTEFAEYSSLHAPRMDLISMLHPPSDIFANDTLFRRGQRNMVITIPADDPFMEDMNRAGKLLSYLMHMKSESQYGLYPNTHYAIYPVAQPFSGNSKVLNFFKSMMPPTRFDYELVIESAAYKKLAMHMLMKMANPDNEKAMWDMHHHSYNTDRYHESAFQERLEAVITNAKLNAKDVHAVMDAATAHEHYAFAAAIRDVGARMFPAAKFGPQITEERSRQRPDDGIAMS